MYLGRAASCSPHNDRTRPAVFIAGGIGITPFMSMLRQAAHDQQRQQSLTLLYSNRRPEDAAFLNELMQLTEHNAGFRLVATMTEMAMSKASCPVFYAAGPPAMVGTLRETLNRAGVDDDDIRSEDFVGY